MSNYNYTCYGSRISSSFPCPDLREVDGSTPPEITVQEGETPDQLSQTVRTAARFSISPGELLLQVDGIARFWVRNGDTITVQRAPGSSLEDTRLFLYGTAFGAAILQQGRVPLHATTVTRDGQTLAFTGPCGAGKSTIAHTLLQRGWKLVCDDVTVVTPSNGTLYAQPGFPSIKLWKDVLNATQTDTSNLKQIRPQINKFRWTAEELFHPEPAPLTSIIGLLPSNKEEIEIMILRGADKFKYLARQTYRRQMITGMADGSRIFGTWAQTLDQVPLWHIQRPKEPMNPAPLADAVEKLLG